jgi:uncharacterized protein (TIGR03067 family)
MAVNINGIWTLVQAELSGVMIAPDDLGKVELIIADDTYNLKINDLIDNGRLKYNYQVYPQTLDVIGIEGVNAGKTTPAIFARNINSLHICYNLEGNEYPKSFGTHLNSKLYFVKYQLQIPKNQ